MLTRRIMTVLAGVVVLTALHFTLAARAGGGGGDDGIRGGLMYDKWWTVAGVATPTGDHPLYPVDGPQSGSSTFRCKECHGWDYKGADGAYAKGSSHYSGIPGIFGTKMTVTELFDLLKFDAETVTNGHAFGDYGLTDQDLMDIVEFIQSYLIDTDVYIDSNDVFLGDALAGETSYFGSGLCYACHGDNGTAINFHDPEEPEWVGTIAVHNPWEFLHKVRFGQPGSAMPTWLGNGGTDQGAADIGAFAQTLPTAPCAGDVNKDGAVDVDDLVDVILGWGNCPP